MISLGNIEECINPDCPGRKKTTRSKKTADKKEKETPEQEAPVE